MFPLLAVAALAGLWLVIRKQSAPSTENPANGGGAATPQGAQGETMGITDRGNQDLLGAIFKSTGTGPAAAAWYTAGPSGLQTTPVGASQLRMLLGAYTYQKAMDYKVDGGMSLTLTPRSYDDTAPSGLQLSSDAQKAGGSVLLWKADVDALAAGQKPDNLVVFTTNALPSWRSRVSFDAAGNSIPFSDSQVLLT